MNTNHLSIAFGDSLKEEAVACISDLAEVGLDAIMDDGILRDIPILSTAVAIYKMGDSIKERHTIKKLLAFLNEMNNGIINEKKRAEYRQKFQSNEKFRNQEIEYLLILIDRYISNDKPQLLAKFYLAYLDELINWFEFTVFAETIERFLPDDIERLFFDFPVQFNFKSVDSAYQRLQAVGLILELPIQVQVENEILSLDDKTKTYDLTDFGKQFVNILQRR